MYKGKSVVVIIPALNEEETIAAVLNDIPMFVDKVVVADNGSTDRTGEIAASGIFGKQVVVCREEKRGYGRACLKGMELIEEEDFVVYLDADYSDDPGFLPALLDPLIEPGMDMVISNRFTPLLEPGAMTLPQRFGNRLAVFLIRLLWGYSYKDLGPFRAIRRTSLEKLDMKDKDYGWTVEMQVKGILKGLQKTHVDIPYRNRLAGTSKVSGSLKGVILAGYKIISRIFLYKLGIGL